MSQIKEGAAGFQRINELMTEMVKAAESGDKVRLVRLSQHFAEDAQDLVGILLVKAAVSDEEMETILGAVSDEQMIKDAASADQIKTASVKA